MKKALLALAVAAALTGCTSAMNHQWHRNCTILDKDVLYDHSSHHDNNGGSSSSSRTKRIGTSCGVFNVEDSISGGYNSYDRWVQLRQGQRYDIETGGYRFGFGNMFPIVIAIDGPK